MVTCRWLDPWRPTSTPGRCGNQSRLRWRLWCCSRRETSRADPGSPSEYQSCEHGKTRVRASCGHGEKKLGRDTASLAFKSRLASSIEIHTGACRRRNASKKYQVYSNGKSETRFERECCCVSPFRASEERLYIPSPPLPPRRRGRRCMSPLRSSARGPVS